MVDDHPEGVRLRAPVVHLGLPYRVKNSTLPSDLFGGQSLVEEFPINKSYRLCETYCTPPKAAPSWRVGESDRTNRRHLGAHPKGLH